MTSTNFPPVIIAGAGPGDPGLITLKLATELGKAAVIITDRLVNPAIIEQHAQPNATVLLVGKQGYNDASFTQEQVTDLLIEQALTGKRILRLKGGDVAIFSNVLHELVALQKHQIPFEIIPGITAASGASAYAGIPLTARGYSQGVQIVTFNPNSHYSPEKWRELANSQETVVFYMAAKNIIDVAELLLRYAKKPNTPLAVIEQATTEHQQVNTTTLQQCAADFRDKSFSSPSLIVYGEVVHLHKQFDWFKTNPTNSVFKQLPAQNLPI